MNLKMNITVNEEQLQEAIEDYLVKQRLPIDGMDLSYNFVQGRGGNGTRVEIEVSPTEESSKHSEPKPTTVTKPSNSHKEEVVEDHEEDSVETEVQEEEEPKGFFANAGIITSDTKPEKETDDTSEEEVAITPRTALFS